MLTPRERECLSAVVEYQRLNNGISPCFETLAQDMGVSSKSLVHRWLTSLENKGFIRRLKNRARAIEVLRPTDFWGERPGIVEMPHSGKVVAS